MWPTYRILGISLTVILEAFAKMQKARSCMSVRTEQLGPHRANFHEILYLSIFRKYTEKIKFSLKCSKNDSYFT
jgi:hypothetical protein